jgi:hypothetical protein
MCGRAVSFAVTSDSWRTRDRLKEAAMGRRIRLTVSPGATRPFALALAIGAVTAISAFVFDAGALLAQSPSPAEVHARAVAGINELVEIGLPRGVWIPLALQPAVRRMLNRSPVFREQCARLSSHRSVHIGVRQDPASLHNRSCAAMAQIRRYQSGIVVVTITMPDDDAPYGMLAHEFEHVLEFLEGLKLRALASSGARQTEFWLANGGVETRRAIEAGRRVAQEMDRPVILTKADHSFWK